MLQKLANRLEDISFEKLPAATVHKTKTAILNYIGGSLPGADAPITMAEKALWAGQGCEGSCTVIGHKGRMAPLAAAAVNATMGQVFLQEDCHERTISHPGVIVIPVALALSQARRLTGKQLIEGVVCGYEGQGRVGKGLIRPGFPDYGLRPAAVVGPFGSVSAASKLLGLDASGIRDALSVAGNLCAGVMECSIVGTEDMCIQNCYSAKNGMQAALEAQAGLHGAYSILDGKFGVGRALNRVECDWSALGETDAYEIDDTFIKVYPGCGHVLATAQAAVALVREYGVTDKDVKHVVVGTKAGGKSFPGCDNAGPFGGFISAMMSHQFMVSAALVTGDVTIAAVKDFANPAIYEMAKRVEVVVDDEVNSYGHEKSGGRVTMELYDGRVISSYQEDTLPQTDEGVDKRMLVNGEAYYTPDRVEKIVDLCHNLEKLDDVSELVDLLEANR
jgi:2-methylcitrate dehydratase PrpD